MGAGAVCLALETVLLLFIWEVVNIMDVMFLVLLFAESSLSFFSALHPALLFSSHLEQVEGTETDQQPAVHSFFLQRQTRSVFSLRQRGDT